MLDQDAAPALLTIADEHGARIAFMGDRHQLPAVGRGGVLDLAARWANHDAVLSLDTVRRFADPENADLSLAMRTVAKPRRQPRHRQRRGRQSRAADARPFERCDDDGRLRTPVQRPPRRSRRRARQRPIRGRQVCRCCCQRSKSCCQSVANADVVDLAAYKAKGKNRRSDAKFGWRPRRDSNSRSRLRRARTVLRRMIKTTRELLTRTLDSNGKVLTRASPRLYPHLSRFYGLLRPSCGLTVDHAGRCSNP